MWQTSGFTPALRLLYDDPTAGNGACRMHVLDMLLMGIMHSGDV